jgi:hypothetical protein
MPDLRSGRASSLPNDVEGANAAPLAGTSERRRHAAMLDFSIPSPAHVPPQAR